MLHRYKVTIYTPEGEEVTLHHTKPHMDTEYPYEINDRKTGNRQTFGIVPKPALKRG